MTRRRRYPPYDEIVRAQAELLKSLPNLDLEDAASTCWACGVSYPSMPPRRAHIVGHAHGGSNEPDNFFLLCWRCHPEQPDGASRETQFAWLRKHPCQAELVIGPISDVVAAIKEVATQYGGIAVAAEFAEYLRQQDPSALVRLLAGRAAGSGYLQEWSNGQWALVDLLHRWARARQVPEGGQLYLIDPESDTKH